MAAADVAPAYAPEDPTLPRPWTGLIDSGTGALYYWNTETNATQYEKPADLPSPLALVPPSGSTPNLAPIPVGRSQPPSDNISQYELDHQIPHQQPLHHLPNHQPHHPASQLTQPYQYMQMNQMGPPQFPKDLQVPQYQGHQQHGLPISNPQPQQNGLPIERDPSRRMREPMGFGASPNRQAGNTLGDHQFQGSYPHIPRAADCSVHPDQQFGRVPPNGTSGAFGELQQSGAGGIHWQQPDGGPVLTNQMANTLSRPPMEQKMGYNDDQHGRVRNEYHSSSNKEGLMLLQQQPLLGSIPHARNQQAIRMGAIPHPVTAVRSGVLIMGQETATPKFNDHAVFPNMASRGPSQNMPGTADLTKIQSADSYCQQHEITVTGDGVPAPFTTFEAAGFAPDILREMYAAGFTSPTPIQAQTWPIAFQSRDIVAIAKTGSGKTLGYLIPAFMHLKQCRNNPRIGPTVVVLSPTRELATQIHVEAIKFGSSSRISCTCLYGGAPKGPQLRDIERGVDIVVATPGRLNDILEMKKINFCQVSFLVLDEADRMLDMGFEPQIRKIVSEILPRRQTLMYTATWPKEVRKIAGDLLVNPLQVNIGNVDELVANKAITQYVEVVQPMEKQRRLEQILRSQERGSKIIIFCSTKRLCDQLARTIRSYGVAVIHGDKSQGERDHVLNQFRIGKAPILVATDVAARGLDVKDIRAVINYDFPTGIEDYVHRIGRTGRAGATGAAYTFISDQDWKHAADIVKILEGSNQHVPPQVREMAARGASSFSRGGHGGTSRWDSGGGRGTRDDASGRGGRWDFGSGGRGTRGMRDGDGGGSYGGRGRTDFASGGRGRTDFASGGRGNRGRGFDRGPSGRGFQDRDISARGRFDIPRRDVERRRDRSYSRSPDRVRTWGYDSSDDSRNRSRSWSRSRSRSRSRSQSLGRLQRVRRPSGFDVPLLSSTLPVVPTADGTSFLGKMPGDQSTMSYSTGAEPAAVTAPPAPEMQ